MTAPTNKNKNRGAKSTAMFTYNFGAVSTSAIATGDWIHFSEFPDCNTLAAAFKGVDGGAGQQLNIQGTNDKTDIWDMPRRDGTANGALDTGNAAAMQISGFPVGEYFRIRFQNGGTSAQTDAWVTLAILS